MAKPREVGSGSEPGGARLIVRSGPSCGDGGYRGRSQAGQGQPGQEGQRLQITAHERRMRGGLGGRRAPGAALPRTGWGTWAFHLHAGTEAPFRRLTGPS